MNSNSKLIFEESFNIRRRKKNIYINKKLEINKKSEEINNFSTPRKS